VKRLFTIHSKGEQQNNGRVLLCELSHYHFCLAVAEPVSKRLVQLSYYEPDGLLKPDDIKDVLEKEAIATNDFKKVVISSAFPEAVVVPRQFFEKENAQVLLQSVYGSVQQPIFYDVLDELNSTLVYAVPPVVAKEFNIFETVQAVHFFTAQIKNANRHAADSKMLVHFTGKEFRVVVIKGNQVLLAQTYPFLTPLDVVYYLLIISREHALSQSGTALVLSGLIDEGSALYKELYQYFSNIHFEKDGVQIADEGNYPNHFFSSIYNLAACVL
jgi:hypothetical protein